MPYVKFKKMEILLKNEQRKFEVDTGKLKTKIKKIFENLDCREKEISILVVNDARMRKLNSQYRDIDRTTDVLSFPQNEGEDCGPNPFLLGDVVISAETAKKQAREHRLSFEQELILLLIHGILHLLGYDHERSKKDEQRMRRKTRDLFQTVFPGKDPANSFTG